MQWGFDAIAPCWICHGARWINPDGWFNEDLNRFCRICVQENRGNLELGSSPGWTQWISADLRHAFFTFGRPLNFCGSIPWKVISFYFCQGRLFFPQNRRFKIPQKDLIDPSVFLVGSSFPVIDSFPPLGWKWWNDAVIDLTSRSPIPSLPQLLPIPQSFCWRWG